MVDKAQTVKNSKRIWHRQNPTECHYHNSENFKGSVSHKSGHYNILEYLEVYWEWGFKWYPSLRHSTCRSFKQMRLPHKLARLCRIFWNTFVHFLLGPREESEELSCEGWPFRKLCTAILRPTPSTYSMKGAKIDGWIIFEGYRKRL